jgi:hypothetical protein
MQHPFKCAFWAILFSIPLWILIICGIKRVTDLERKIITVKTDIELFKQKKPKSKNGI